MTSMVSFSIFIAIVKYLNLSGEVLLAATQKGHIKVLKYDGESEEIDAVDESQQVHDIRLEANLHGVIMEEDSKSEETRILILETLDHCLDFNKLEVTFSTEEVAFSFSIE